MRGQVVLAFIGGIAVSIATPMILHRLNHTAAISKDETIAFADRSFFDSAKMNNDPQFETVTAQGTYNGAGLIKNNSVTVTCRRTDARCDVGTLAQIGENQVSEIDLSEWPVTQWAPTLIVAEDDEYCSTTTMNIDRLDHRVSFVQVPKNVTADLCKKAPATVQKWEIDRSLFWRRVDPNDAAKN